MTPDNLRPIPCAYDCTATGNQPVREFFKGLLAEERKIIGADIVTIQFGWPLGMPLVNHLGAGLWEMRTRLPSRIVRTIFVVEGGEIVLLHSFLKKTRSTPIQELKLALRRKREIQKT